MHEKYGLPKLQSMSQSLQNTTPRVIEEELSYDTSYLQGKVTEQYRTLNKHQQHIFDTIMDSVNNSKGKVFCMTACGGSSKTYTINLLLAAVRAQGGIVLGTALSGIALHCSTMGGRRTVGVDCPSRLMRTACAASPKRNYCHIY